MPLKPILCCPLVVRSVITVKTHLSGLVRVRNSDPVGSIWNVIVRLILVDVLNKQKRLLLQWKHIVCTSIIYLLQGFTPLFIDTVILTALSDRESVCKMSNMVFNTRPLHSRWGNLVKVKHIRNRIHAVYIITGKNVTIQGSWIIKLTSQPNQRGIYLPLCGSSCVCG